MNTRRLTGPDGPVMTVDEFANMVIDNTHGNIDDAQRAWCRVVRAVAVARGDDRHTAAVASYGAYLVECFDNHTPIVEVMMMVDCDATGYTGGFTPDVVADRLTRDDLIQWLCYNDRNGCYSDVDGAAEGFDPLTYADAYGLVLDALGAS